MAESGGHWKTLAEAAKLTQSTKIPGVIEEDIKRNNPIERLPVAQASGTGLKIEWLREKEIAEEAVQEIDIGGQLSWSKDIEYTEVESTLRRIYIQRKLDHYVAGIYGTYNDYKAQMLLECEKGLKRRLGDRLLYADNTYGGTPAQFDGIHALAAERGNPYAAADTAGSKLNIDMNEGPLSLQFLRMMIDAMKFGCDELWIPGELGIRFDQAYEERGFITDFVQSSSGPHGIQSLLTRSYNDIGKPIMYFMGVPIIRMDFLVAEEGGTGVGDDEAIRAKNSSSPYVYSIFGVKFGNVMERDPGICYAYGGTEGAGDFYKLRQWADLEDYDAAGMRLVNYGSVLLGSTLCLGRIFDITDAAIVV